MKKQASNTFERRLRQQAKIELDGDVWSMTYNLQGALRLKKKEMKLYNIGT